MGVERFAEAELNLRKSIELDNNLPAAYYNLAKLYDAQNNKEKALDYYQKTFELDEEGSVGNLAAKRYNSLLVE